MTLSTTQREVLSKMRDGGTVESKPYDDLVARAEWGTIQIKRTTIESMERQGLVLLVGGTIYDYWKISPLGLSALEEGE